MASPDLNDEKKKPVNIEPAEHQDRCSAGSMFEITLLPIRRVKGQTIHTGADGMTR